MPVKIVGLYYYAPKELAKLLSVSIPTAHKLISDNGMATVRIGSKILVPATEVIAYLSTVGIKGAKLTE